jgi:hypothetical protein
MTKTSDHHPTSTPRPVTSHVWLDVVSAVDYLGAGHRYGLTIWDAVEEALRWWNAGHLTGGDTLDAHDAAQLPWDDPDPLRTALEHLVLHLDTPGVPGAIAAPDALHEALTYWVARMATEYNDGHPWTHPTDERGYPTPLPLPFDTDTEP